ncbi:uncharacterized protein LOC141680325 [Apium graveolens]|uniref:uncharacterized protein LOC141680325 n=1 Tax=Apium graveolens TaxID=4045 RepID=UPI003D790244
MVANKSKEGAYGLSYPMLTKANYTIWAVKMKVFMQAHGVWDGIEPKDPKAVIEEKMDKRALDVIYQGILDDMLLTIAEKKTSKEAWGAIKIMCVGADKVRKAKAHTLKSEFESLRMKETEQLDDFFMRLNGLVTNIRALGEKIEEENFVKNLLRAVPTKFLQIASTIEQFGNLDAIYVEEVMGSLKAHEERLHGQVENNEVQQLLLTADEWLKKENNEEKLLHTREEWLKRSAKTAQPGGNDYRTRDNRIKHDRSQLKCFNCNGYGHFAAECRKPRRAMQQRGEVNLAQLNKDEPALLMALCENNAEDVLSFTEDRASNNIREIQENTRYLDNGVSNHMTGHREKFEKLDKAVKEEVKFGDGSLESNGGSFRREPGIKAFRLFDPITNSILISRDVVFVEQKGWNLENATDSRTQQGGQFVVEDYTQVAVTESTGWEDEPVSAEPHPPNSPSTPQASLSTNMSSQSHSQDDIGSSVSSSSNEQPHSYRKLDEIYINTTAIQLEEELLLMGIDEPFCFEQAIVDDVWKQAMTEKIKSIEKNNTWHLTDLPKGHKAIDLKWVFKVKKDQHGEVTIHKARLVAKGYVQRYGVDYEEVLAPVTRLETVRLLLALATKHSWKVHHLDVKSDFLNGVILEEVYERNMS